ncbi:hypothetical protein [Spirosoma pollinicola]|uniref:Uncharacterized protein n=1 Tax=Spirosoma pollinicola TaxID=2057025 RepID=A0A2K8YTL4_9BACT|nr:hypothetical protein [Spirosoma pollinicola]AUD00975.1 hypothetical protein CWM47_03560 [Spirosoma pollinicola]
MAEEKESLHIKFEGASGNEVIIRHGQAEPIHVPKPISLSGNFKAPAEFVAKRFVSVNEMLDQYPAEECHVLFNEGDLSITLVAGEQERDTITVVGKLTINPFLSSLNINGRGHKHSDLLTLIRFVPHYFALREDHKKLVIGLQNFEVKTDTEHKAQNDRQGTVENRQFTRAQSSLTGMNIRLMVPLFEGYEPAPVDLTIEIEPNNGTVLIYLVSETFQEFYDDAVKALFDEQRPVFEPFVIIDK